MSVEFHKDKAIEATEKVIETGREITSGISRGVGEAEKKADEQEAEKTNSIAKQIVAIRPATINHGSPQIVFCDDRSLFYQFKIGAWKNPARSLTGF